MRADFEECSVKLALSVYSRVDFEQYSVMMMQQGIDCLQNSESVSLVSLCGFEAEQQQREVDD